MSASLLSIAAALIGVAGVLLAIQADKRAEKANRVAEDALTAADEANRLAGEANKLASDANAVSERALNVSSESIEYDWGFECDDRGWFTVRNDSPVDAVDVTLVIRDEHGAEVRDTYGTVPAVSEVSLDSEGMVSQHLERVRDSDRHVIAMFDNEIIYSGRNPVSSSFRCYLTWDSPRGKELSAVLDLTLRHRVTDDDGTIERMALD